MELLEGVVLPLFMEISEERDEDICCEVMQLLVLILSESTPQWAPSVIGIINSVSGLWSHDYHMITVCAHVGITKGTTSGE